MLTHFAMNKIQMKPRVPSSAAVVLALALACGPKDGETNATTEATTTSASTTSEPTTGASEGATTTTVGTSTEGTATTAGTSTEGTAATSAGTSTGGSSTGEAPPVECDGVTCASGQLCLWPPSYCDYNEMPPEVKREGKMCADFPPACADVTEGLAICLSESLCPDSVLHEGTSFEMGLLDCFPAWNDCF